MRWCSNQGLLIVPAHLLQAVLAWCNQEPVLHTLTHTHKAFKPIHTADTERGLILNTSHMQPATRMSLFSCPHLIPYYSLPVQISLLNIQFFWIITSSATVSPISVTGSFSGNDAISEWKLISNFNSFSHSRPKVANMDNWGTNHVSMNSKYVAIKMFCVWI